MANLRKYSAFRQQIFLRSRRLESTISQFRRCYVLSKTQTKYSKGERSGPSNANVQCYGNIYSNFYTSTTSLHTRLPRQSNYVLELMANIQSRTLGTKSAALNKVAPKSDEKALNNNPDIERKSSPSKLLTQRQRLAKTLAEYGTTATVFFYSISFTALGICYAVVSSGVDMVSIFESFGLSSDGIQGKLASGAGTLAIAYALHVVFLPVRIFLTGICTPPIVRRLRARGFLRMPAKNSTP